MGVIRSYAIPEESMSEMKEPLEVVHLIAVGAAALLLLEVSLGGWTMERLAGERLSGMEMVPPPL